MAIGNKRRFEVFKRDSFRCTYCGRSPPDVILELDHIQPRAGGGGDEETNLVTSCFECNRGKSDTPLDSIPEAIEDQLSKQVELVAQLAAMNTMLLKSHQASRRHVEYIADYCDTSFRRGLDAQSRASLKLFLKRLDAAKVIEAIDITVSKGKKGGDAFKYFCGVCWGMIRQKEAE